MELQKLCDGVYYLPNSEETDRPALGYVLGDHYAVMIDCGNSPAHYALFCEALREKDLPLPKTAIITHWHWDHTFAMCAFEGLIAASKATNRQLQIMETWQCTDEAMRERLITGEDIEFCDTHIRLEYPDLSDIKVRCADIVFDDKITFDLGGVRCEATRIGGPHSEDSVAVYVPERRVLFVGDASSGDFYGMNGAYDKARLAAYIEYLRSVNFDIYVHGHTPPKTKDRILQDLSAELAEL